MGFKTIKYQNELQLASQNGLKISHQCILHCILYYLLYNVHRRLMAPLPCPDCERVAFCGEFCKRTALESYHAIECSMLPALFSAGVSITCLIALRIITQQPLKYFINLRPKLLNHVITARWSFGHNNIIIVYTRV